MPGYNLPPYQPSHTGPLGPVDLMRIDRRAYVLDYLSTILYVQDPVLETQFAQSAGQDYDYQYRDQGRWYLPIEARRELLGEPPVAPSPQS